MRFFSYNSPFNTWLRRTVDYALLGMLWFLTSLPIITYGAATSAALITAEKSIRQDSGQMLATFFRHFGREFRQATCLWLIQLPITLLIVINIRFIALDDLPYWLEIAIAALCLIVFSEIKLWLAYQSTFTDSLKTVLRNCMLIGVVQFLPVLGMGLAELVCLVIAFLLFWTTAPLMVLVPGLYLYLYSALSRRAFKRYIPLAPPAEEEESV